MGTYEKLYLANNVEALDLLAKRDFDPTLYSFKQICNFLGTLYKKSQLNVLDQEKTYILLARYLLLYSHLKNTQTDKKFIELRFGSEYDKVLMQYEGTKKSLEERYAAKAKSVPAKPVPEEKETAVQVKKRVFNDEFITCQQLFSALYKSFNMLLVDARPENDFAESRINHPNCINVPDHCITAGLSANVLGQRLPPETQKIWELRDTYDVIVLFDWNTSSDNFALTKLYKLRSALIDWDLNRNYSEPPVILNGGYLELLQMYPTICINPHVYLFQKNNELDELLELDNIKYPTESDNKTLVMGVPEDNKVPEVIDENEIFTKESLLEDAKEISITRQGILAQLRQEESDKKLLDDLCNKENNINNIANMKTTVSDIDTEINRLEEVLSDLNIKRGDIKKRLKNTFQYDLEDEKLEIKEDEKMVEEDSEKLKDIIHEERNKELIRARALKPKTPENNSGSFNNNTLQDPVKPVINRATKPAMHPYGLRAKIEPLEYITPGLVGLINIRNTCYMSTAIHCLRNVPAITQLYCLDVYKKYIIRRPAAIINETALLIRDIFSTSQKVADPSPFFRKVCQLEPSYGEGNHEDCMEFFLFLLNHLCEDCLYDGPVPAVMTPKQKAWYNQFEGKSSVFIDLFYHQIRIVQNCVYCNKKTYKFEIESTFMLSVPDHDFTLDQLMNEYMADYVIPDYCCSKCKKPVQNQKKICYEPKIMVIVLKRYRQVITDNGVSLKKVESRAHFQKRNFKLGNCLYQLNAVALHSGNMDFGHYTAAALTSKGWYEFNDQTVRPININDDSVKLKACAFFYSMSDDKDD